MITPEPISPQWSINTGLKYSISCSPVNSRLGWRISDNEYINYKEHVFETQMWLHWGSGNASGKIMVAAAYGELTIRFWRAKRKWYWPGARPRRCLSLNATIATDRSAMAWKPIISLRYKPLEI